MYSGIMSFSDSVIIAGKDRAPIKPYLEISCEKGRVLLDFEMNGQKLIAIYCKRATESEFTLLDTVSKSHYIDLRPNVTEYAESREYKAVYLFNNQPVGDPDFLTVKTKGKFRFF